MLVPGQMLRSARFAEKNRDSVKSLVDARARAKPCYASAACLGPGRSAPDLPRKTVLRARLLSYSRC